jgi:hypothetical protein
LLACSFRACAAAVSKLKSSEAELELPDLDAPFEELELRFEAEEKLEPEL